MEERRLLTEVKMMTVTVVHKNLPHYCITGTMRNNKYNTLLRGRTLSHILSTCQVLLTTCMNE